MDEHLLATATIEELFQDYLKAYGPKLQNTEKYKDLVDALRDAFFAGMAVEDTSPKSHTIELLMYIRGAHNIKPSKTANGEEFVN